MDAVAAILRHADADAVVLAGVDWDMEGHTLAALADAVGGYPHRFAARPNRGIDTGSDIDGDGRRGRPDDLQGYAEFPGQEGLAILSRLAIDRDGLRDFSDYRWHDLPGGVPPPGTPENQRLSTAAHWDVPLALDDGSALHLLVWHATPPVFDGPEDRNGRRNRDEALFWQRYLDGDLTLPPPEDVVLMGAANLDPVDGDGRPDALLSLLGHPALQDPQPRSRGGAAAAADGVNMRHVGDPTLDTADWPDDEDRPGNLRVDYILPAARLKVLDSGVLWPDEDGQLRRDALAASRHRLIWVDLRIEDALAPALAVDRENRRPRTARAGTAPLDAR